MGRPFTLFTGQWVDLPLEEVARLAAEWGYDGLIMSDWFATKSAAGSVNGGLDLVMPGPVEWWVDGVLAATEGLPHIFNLGHGITPQTPIAHVEQMLKRLRG